MFNSTYELYFWFQTIDAGTISMLSAVTNKMCMPSIGNEGGCMRTLTQFPKGLAIDRKWLQGISYLKVIGYVFKLKKQTHDK